MVLLFVVTKIVQDTSLYFTSVIMIHASIISKNKEKCSVTRERTLQISKDTTVVQQNDLSQFNHKL